MSPSQDPKDDKPSVSDAPDGAPPRRAPEEESGESLLSHLIELRDRLLRIVLAVLVIFIVLFPFANPIYTALATPLMAQLPEGSSMIAIDVAAPFLVPFKLVFLLAFVLAVPYVLYQVWAFVAPGLYESEKRLAAPLVLSSTLLFYLGMAFAYFVVFPLIFAFFTATAPEGVAVMTDISRYLSFVIMLFIAFGVAFEMPIATILLVATGATTPEALARKRPYVIVGVFVVGMVLTPPDIISQTLLAVPMWLLFELGLLLSRVIVRRRAAADDGSDDPLDDEADRPRRPGSGPPDDGGSAPSETPRPTARYAPARIHGVTPAAATSGAPVPTGSSGARADASSGDFEPLSPEAMDDELERASREIEALRAANRAKGEAARAAARRAERQAEAAEVGTATPLPDTASSDATHSEATDQAPKTPDPAVGSTAAGSAAGGPDAQRSTDR